MGETIKQHEQQATLGFLDTATILMYRLIALGPELTQRDVDDMQMAILEEKRGRLKQKSRADKALMTERQ